MLSIDIVILSDPDYYPPTINAANILAEKGHRVTLIGIKYPKVQAQRVHGHIQRIDYGRHRTGLMNILQYCWFYVWYLFRLLRRRPHWVLAYDAMSAGPVRFAAGISGVKWAFHSHDLLTDAPGWYRFIAWMEKKAMRHADLVSFPQEDRAGKLMKEARLATMPSIVYNGPRQSWSRRELPPHAALRDWISQNKFIVLYQGQFASFFNLEVLIRSMALLPGNVCLCMIGRALEEGITGRYELLIKELGLTARIKLLPSVPYDEVPSVTKNCHLGVAKLAFGTDVPFNDYFLTGASNKISEYLNCGLPVLMAETEVNTSFYGHRGFAVFVSESSPEAVASAIARVYEQPALYQSLKAAAVRAGQEVFNYDAQFEKIAQRIGS